MTTLTRLLLTAALLAPAAAFAADKPPADPPAQSKTVADVHAARIAKLEKLVKYLEQRVTAGISRSQDVMIPKAALARARASAAMTDGERLKHLKNARQVLLELDKFNNALIDASAVGGAGGIDTATFTVIQTEAIMQAGEVELAILALEAKLKK